MLVKLSIILFSNSHNSIMLTDSTYIYIILKIIYMLGLILMAFLTYNNILLITPYVVCYLNMQNLYKRTNNN